MGEGLNALKSNLSNTTPLWSLDGNPIITACKDGPRLASHLSTCCEYKNSRAYLNVRAICQE